MASHKPFQAVPIQLGARHRAKRKRDCLLRLLVPAGVFAGAALIGGGMGVVSTLTPRPASGEIIADCTVTDGDTIRCGAERIRLLGIDAPELPGHCRAGRVCAPGDPYASITSLEEAMSGELWIERVGEDRYGRTLAMVRGASGDLSCWQLRHGQAIYKANWDDGRRLAAICPTAMIGGR